MEVVLTSGDLIILMNRGGDRVTLDGGIVAGTLFFSRDTPTRVSIDQSAPQLTASTLINDYWGSYVAILLLRNGHFQILRDPSAAMPCYYIEHPDGLIFSSDVELLYASGEIDVQIDWHTLGWFLGACYPFSAATCLSGIKELIRGHCLDVDGRESRISCCWSPWSFTSREPIRSKREAVERLRSTTTTCVKAWANCFDHILLSVSGGLDSSVVAAALTSAGIKTSLLTIATESAAGDERRYARLLADALDLPLHEALYDSSAIDFRQSTSALLPRPCGRPAAQISRDQCLRVAHEHDVDALFDGGGGDSVFCSLSSATPLADRILSEGLRPALWSTVDDLQRMSGSSLWEIARRGLKRAWFQPNRYIWHYDSSFLRRKKIEPFKHPWLEAHDTALPGHGAHIASLLMIHNFGEGTRSNGFLPSISPLLSQPLIELCLQIPSWNWCSGGINRSLVRQAFESDLPSKILRRTWKGGPSSVSYQLYTNDRKQIREYLLGGVLAEHEILDTHDLVATLDDPASPKGRDHLRIFELVDAEAWARNWLQHPTKSMSSVRTSA